MVFTSIRFKGKTIYPYQIVNNKFEIKQNGVVYKFPYRLNLRDIAIIENEDLIIKDYAYANGDESISLSASSGYFVYEPSSDTLVIVQ